MRWGANFDHKIDGVIEAVKFAMYRKWLRVKNRKIEFKKSGRPRIPECVRKIVRRMAVENVLWGYARIVGEAVVVSSPKVAAPVAVGHAWQDFPLCNLYSKEGFPADPFRTDDSSPTEE